MQHEQLKDFQNVTNISNKSFGIQLSIILFLIFSIRFYLNYFDLLEYTLIFLSIFFFIISFLKPILLTWIKNIFLNFAVLLAKVINPILMLIFYILFFLPFGLILKIFRYDPLKEKMDSNLKSYWNFKKDYKQYFKKQF